MRRGGKEWFISFPCYPVAKTLESGELSEGMSGPGVSLVVIETDRRVVPSNEQTWGLRRSCADLTAAPKDTCHPSQNSSEPGLSLCVSQAEQAQPCLQ